MRRFTATNPDGFTINKNQGVGSMGKEETEIQNAIRVVLSEIGIVKRNNVGTFYTFDGRPIAIGIPGEADLTLFQNGGKTVFIEVKTPKGKQNKWQKHFQNVVERRGYEYIIMRSVDDARRYIKDVKHEGGL